MFIHLGNNINILTSEIIAILNYQTLKKAKDNNKQFLENTFNEKNINSIIITKDKTIASPIASTTLKKRSQLKIS
jgi:hypothetical protein